jgi:hypothetical protein
MFPTHSVCQLLWLFLVRLLVEGKVPGWGHYQNKGTTQGGCSQGGAHILVTPSSEVLTEHKAIASSDRIVQSNISEFVPT